MNSLKTNVEYYERDSPAREDYWRYMAAPRARVERVVKELRRLRPRSVADLGCGDGRLLEEIARALPEARLAGVDLSRRQIETNRTKAPHVRWAAGDLQEPIEVFDTFEAIVASEVIEHLTNPAMLLVNAHRLAATGAHLVLTTQSGPVRETERRVGHERHFKPAELRALLESNGWTPLRVWNEGFPFHDLSKWWANRDPDASMARFGTDRPYGLAERAVCLALRGAFRLNSRSRGAQLYAVAVRA
jgi:SAM-dependent methyltransferase